MEADDDAARDAKLRDHARQVRDHVVKLGNKTYWAHFQPAPDLVIMFVPGETLLSTALQRDPSLLEFSLGRGVMLASPLDADGAAARRRVRVAAGEDRQERAGDQRPRAAALRRIRVMAVHFEDVARGLTRSVESYNRAVGSLESRVLVTARRLKDKGVTAPEELPGARRRSITRRGRSAPPSSSASSTTTRSKGVDRARTDASLQRIAERHR